MKKIFTWISTFWHGLFYGMKATDEIMLTGNTDTIPGSAIIQEVNDHRVSKALLKGEVTQEVEELRYRTYKVDREAKQYEYIAPTLAFKRDKQDSKFVSYEKNGDLELITIQPNEAIVEEISKSLEYVGTYGQREEYLIKLKRNFFPRYRLEAYTKRLAIFKLDETHAILDFYVSKYPNDKDFKSKGFVREIEKIKDEQMRSDVLDIDNVSFTTSHAFKLNDLLQFEFKNLEFKGISEFDGHYVIKFKAFIVKNGYDLTEQYYSASMEKKYQNKEKKEVVLDLFGAPQTEVYKCERCGKEIVYDPVEMEEMAITKPREIDEEDNNSTHTTEFMDAQIAQQTYGVLLCKDCLKKYLKENNLI